MASKPRKSEWVYDELLYFLGNPFFQIPVITFIEANCLIFDPSVEDSPEYKTIHGEYKKLVDALLESFMKDSGLSQDQIVRAMAEMNSKQDLREIFQGLFEQVLAMDDYVMFVRLMTQKNIELQQQALVLIIQTTGALPESLQDSVTPAPVPAPPKSLSQKPSAGPANQQHNEDEIMRKILEQSKREYDMEQKLRPAEEKEKDKEHLQAMVIVSHVNLEGQKQKEKEKLNAAMAQLSLDSTPAPAQAKNKPQQVPHVYPPPSQSQPPSQQTSLQTSLAHPSLSQFHHPPPAQLPQPRSLLKAGSSLASTPIGGKSIGPTAPQLSSSEAAANWLKSAQAEASSSPSHSTAVTAAAAALSKLNPEELKKRQEYLKQQRDKLLEMKRKEREKQLLSAEQSLGSDRPMSARVARNAMKATEGQGDPPKLSPEEEKKLAMRRAIANKLKSELIGQK